MQLRMNFSVLLLLVAFAVPAYAFDEVAVHLDPLQPYSGDDFVVVIEGEADTPPVLETVLRYGRILEIILVRQACPPANCSPVPFRLEVPIDGSTDPFPNGFHTLKVSGRAGPELSSLFESFFGIGDRAYHSMQPNIVIEPQEPSDNDRLHLLVPVVANTCGPSAPELERIERNGDLVSIFMKFDPGFGPERATVPGPSVKCSPAVPFLDVSQVDLGFLEAGSYIFHLYFKSTRGDALPVRVATTSFAIADGPDQVDLREDRFTVEVEWKDHEGNRGVGKPVADPAADSTLFTFFGRDNWELLIKVLDGCDINGHYWVFGSAATDVEYTVTVTDTQTGLRWDYFNPLGNASDAINDSTAFATCLP